MVILTLGSVSVVNHDLMHIVLAGLSIDFSDWKINMWKINMRPGKLLQCLAASVKQAASAVPNNLVASLICSHILLKPLLAKLGGGAFAYM